MSEFHPCPTCQSSNVKAVAFTWWGGALVPRLFHLVRCNQCGEEFNGQTGASNKMAVRIYIWSSSIAAIFLALAFYLGSKMKSILGAVLSFGLISSLAAQDKPYLGHLQRDDGVVYSFQLRAVRAGGGLEGMVSNRTGGGGGFSAMFGDAPVRLRLRMDGDAFPGRDGQGNVSCAGLGAEGVYFFPSFDWMTPYLSLGAAIQHWEVLQAKYNPSSSRTANHIAGRAEFGMKLGRSATLSLGVLVGITVNGSKATNPYIAVAF